MNQQREGSHVRLCPEHCQTCHKQAKFALYPIFGMGSLGARFPLAIIQCAWCLERFLLSRSSPYYPSGHKQICPQRPAPGGECDCTLVTRYCAHDSGTSSNEVSSSSDWDTEEAENHPPGTSDSSISSGEVSSTTDWDTEGECWDDDDRDYGAERCPTYRP